MANEKKGGPLSITTFCFIWEERQLLLSGKFVFFFFKPAMRQISVWTPFITLSKRFPSIIDWYDFLGECFFEYSRMARSVRHLESFYLVYIISKNGISQSITHLFLPSCPNVDKNQIRNNCNLTKLIMPVTVILISQASRQKYIEIWDQILSWSKFIYIEFYLSLRNLFIFTTIPSIVFQSSFVRISSLRLIPNFSSSAK